MNTLLNRLAVKYGVESKVCEATPLARALRRYVVQAVKCEIPLYHAPHALFEALTTLESEDAKEHHDNLKKTVALLKDIVDCMEKAGKEVQTKHAGAVLQKGKNYL